MNEPQVRVQQPYTGISPSAHKFIWDYPPKNIPGKWRLTADLSSPGGMSINDGILEELCSLSYVGVEEAVKGILCMYGGLCGLRWISRAPSRGQTLPGMLWEGALYIDTALLTVRTAISSTNIHGYCRCCRIDRTTAWYKHHYSYDISYSLGLQAPAKDERR